MRILFISNLYPNSVEPNRATYNRALLKAMRDLGHAVEVIAPLFRAWPVDALRGRTMPPAVEKLDGIRVWHPRFRYPAGVLVKWHYWLYRRAVVHCLQRVVTEFRPDRVILGFVYPDAVALASVCEKLRVPYAVRVNGSDFRLRITQHQFRDRVLQTLKAAPVVLCPGQALRRDMIAAGVVPERIVAFNNGVDRSVFYVKQEWPQKGTKGTEEGERKKKFVLFVGNMLRVKGLDRLLAVWSELRGSGRIGNDVELVLIGNGARRAGAIPIPAETGIQWLGEQSQTTVAEWMRRATCLCLPSRSEGMPNVVLEALACGTPVVAMEVGEVPFLIQDGLNGYRVRTVSELGEKLELALARDWNRTNVAATVKGYDWQQAATMISAALLISGGSRAVSP